MTTLQQPVSQSSPFRTPFRFMDLPSELRIMVYERVPREVRHITLRTVAATSPGVQPQGVTLITHIAYTSILGTCRAIYQEAHPFIQKTIREWVYYGGVKVICSTDEVSMFAGTMLFHVVSTKWRKLTNRGPNSRINCRLQGILESLGYSYEDGEIGMYGTLFETMQESRNDIKRWIKRSASVIQHEDASMQITLRSLAGEDPSPRYTSEVMAYIIRWFEENMRRSEEEGICFRTMGWVDSYMTQAPCTFGALERKYLGCLVMGWIHTS